MTSRPDPLTSEEDTLSPEPASSCNRRRTRDRRERSTAADRGSTAPEGVAAEPERCCRCTVKPLERSVAGRREAEPALRSSAAIVDTLSRHAHLAWPQRRIVPVQPLRLLDLP